MSQYRNNRIARVGDRVLGTLGSQVVTGLVLELGSSTAKIAYQDTARTVVENVDLGNYFLAEDALGASNAVNNKIAQTAPVAPVAAPQPLAVVPVPAPAPAAAREALPGWTA